MKLRVLGGLCSPGLHIDVPSSRCSFLQCACIIKFQYRWCTVLLCLVGIALLACHYIVSGISEVGDNICEVYYSAFQSKFPYSTISLPLTPLSPHSAAGWGFSPQWVRVLYMYALRGLLTSIILYFGFSICNLSDIFYVKLNGLQHNLITFTCCMGIARSK